MNRRFRPSDWLLVGGGLLMLMASVLPWWEVSWGGRAPQASFDAFTYTLTGLVPLVALLVVAVLVVIIKTESLALPAWLVDRKVVAVVVGVATVLVGARFIWSGFDADQGARRGVGLYLAVVAVLVCIGGCVLSFRELRADELAAAAGDDEDDEDEDEDDDDELDADELVDVNDDLPAHFRTRAPRTLRPPADPGRSPVTGASRPRRRREGTPSLAPRTRRRPNTPGGP